MKVFVITKKTGILYMLIAMLALSLVYIGKSDVLPVSGAKRDLPIYSVQKPENEISSSCVRFCLSGLPFI